MGAVTGEADVFDSWIERGSALAELLGRTAAEQRSAGYFHTLREICQQPQTWIGTATAARERRLQLTGLVDSCRALIFSGSGSSQYCGDCLAPGLRRELGVPVESASSGWFLIDGDLADLSDGVLTGAGPRPAVRSVAGGRDDDDGWQLWPICTLGQIVASRLNAGDERSLPSARESRRVLRIDEDASQ